jgi:hypothetical protein
VSGLAGDDDPRAARRYDATELFQDERHADQVDGDDCFG